MRQQAFDADHRAVVYAPGEGPSFTPGDHVRFFSRTPIAPHRMPFYLLGKRGKRASSGLRRSTTTKALSPERPSQSRTTTVSPSQ
jgi:hypothetical protein